MPTSRANNVQAKTYFRKWYGAKKDAISEARKTKYHTDPEYRAKALANARKQRQARNDKTRPEALRTFKYSAREAADLIGCTTNELRAWRVRDYYPTPFYWAGRTYYSEMQVQLMQKLQAFLEANGPRIKQDDREAFEDLKTLIATNWE